MHQTYSPHHITMNPQFPENEHLNCPRCDSGNTKFCYYNNYNLSQPRHFCKNCRRYWTKGGTLRNIPVGGGTRKTTAKRASNSNKRPAGSDSQVNQSPSPPPPRDRAETETKTSGILGYRSDRMKLDGESFESMLKSNQRLQFGSFLDGLRPNLSGADSNSPVTTPSPPPPPPESKEEMETESFESMLKSNQRLQFGSFVDGSEADGLIRAPATTGVLRKQYLSLNGDHDERGGGGGGGGREESSGCDGGGNRWPNLSIFTPGSNLH